MRKLGAILCLLLALSPVAARAAFERSIFQYTHQRWSDESDAPRPVVALTQDNKGYLWVATAVGLFRFDGIRFEPMSDGLDPVVNGPPSALLVRRNGEVWTNFERSRRFAAYRNGRLRFLRAPLAPDRVIAMQETQDGTVWVLTERIGLPLMRYRDGRWTSFGIEAGAPLDNPFSMVVTREGIVWVSYTGSVARIAPNGRRFEVMRQTPHARGRLSMDPQGRIWLTERHGTYPITGADGHGGPPTLHHVYATDAAEIRGWPTFDRDGNLWIATYYGGVQRVTRPDPRGAASPREAVSRVERFTSRDGLSSNVTTQIFQDREGNVWVATEKGLDRFWPATLRFEPRFTDPAGFGDLLLQGSDGTVYVGEATTVYRVRPGQSPEPIFRTRTEPRTLCEAPDGAIWIGVGRDILIWRDGRVRRLGQSVPLSYTLYDCAFDAHGDYWVTASLGGMARYRAGRWERMFGPPGDTFLPKSMVTDAHGRIVLQWNDRRITRLDGPAPSTALIPLGGYPPEDVALYPAPPDTLFVAGRFGLARLRNGQFRSISAHRVPRFSGVNGMVQTPNGESWLAGPGGILRIASAQLERAFSHARETLPMRVFGAADGLRSTPHDHSRRSIVRGGDGRLWIATQTGTLWLDPSDIARSRTPPQVSISAVSADRLYRDPVRVALPAGTSNVQIDFAVLNFSNPRQARARYRIEGQDPEWIEAGTRRQAFYTNLAPGTYRFRLIAANDDGIWNEQGATAEFVIPPTFTQSRWFLLLCILAALALVWALLRWRYAEAARRLRNRLEERIKERERIARDLHDTLLQGVQGLVLSFQAVADRISPSEADRRFLQSTLDQADKVIIEARERVRSLRGHEESADLQSVIRDLVDAAPFAQSVQVAIEIEGRPREIHPFVLEEVSLIGGEALFNIARHSRATKVMITIEFGRRNLLIAFRDNGVGIPEEILCQGRRDGHYGLGGMRERSERIGGLFSISSDPARGTEVAVSLVAKLAYLDAGSSGYWKRLRRLFASDRPDG